MITFEGPFTANLRSSITTPTIGLSSKFPNLKKEEFDFVETGGKLMKAGMNGIYMHGISSNYIDQIGSSRKIFIPLNIGEGIDVEDRLKTHFIKENFSKHPIFQLKNLLPVGTSNLQSIEAILKGYRDKPSNYKKATINKFTSLIISPAWQNVLWHHHINFFNAVANPSGFKSTYANNGQDQSIIADYALFSGIIWSGGTWLNELHQNRQLLFDNFMCFYAELPNDAIESDRKIIEGKVKWFFEQFGYYTYSKANNMAGLTFNNIPPNLFDFNSINNFLVQGVLSNDAGLIPPSIPDFINII